MWLQLTECTVYYGQEQHLNGSFNPVNREAEWLTGYNTTAPLYKLIASLNRIRTHAFQAADTYATYISFVVYHDNHVMAMRKGFDGSQVITVLTNLGEESNDQTLSLKNTGFNGGEKVMEVLTCQQQTTHSDGSIDVKIHRGLPSVFYPSAGLKGSKVCQKISLSAAPHPLGKRNSAMRSTSTFSQGSVPAFVIGILSLWIPLILWRI
jgi:alpha-amylase